jgi:vacuolar protein sorting-associated protein 54
MASSHSSSPVPQGSSSDVFFKKEVDPTKHIRPVQSLPDVCPKEPTGNYFLRNFLMISVIKV